MTLYKYMTPERVDVLQSEHIRYTQPIYLNDPFEMRPTFGELLADDDLAKAFRGRARREAIDKALERVPAQYRRRARIFAWIFLFVHRRKIRENIKTIAAALGVQFRKQFPQMLERLRTTVGVLSLSTKPDNLLMWSHYAGQHTGFVLAVDEAHPAFNERRSSDDEFFHLRQVVYSRQKPKHRLSDLNGIDLLLRKSSDWAYEEEWRIVKTLDQATAMGSASREVYLFSLPASAIQGVVLGAHISDDDRERFRAILSEARFGHVWLKQAEVERESFGLKFRRLPKMMLGYPSCDCDFHTEEADRERAPEIFELLKITLEAVMSQPLDMSRLKHVHICANVSQKVADMLGKAAGAGEADAEVLGLSTGHEVDVVVILKSAKFGEWASLTDGDKKKLIHWLHREWAHVHNVTLRYRALGEKALTEAKPGTAGYLAPVALAVWNDYIVAKLSASSLVDSDILAAATQVLETRLKCQKAVAEEIKAHRARPNLDRLMWNAAQHMREHLGAMATLLGYLAGGHTAFRESVVKSLDIGGKSYEQLSADLKTALQTMDRYYPEWEDFGIYDDLMYVVRSLGFLWGLALREMGKRMHVAIP